MRNTINKIITAMYRAECSDLPACLPLYQTEDRRYLRSARARRYASKSIYVSPGSFLLFFLRFHSVLLRSFGQPHWQDIKECNGRATILLIKKEASTVRHALLVVSGHWRLRFALSRKVSPFITARNRPKKTTTSRYTITIGTRCHRSLGAAQFMCAPRDTKSTVK